MDKRLLGRGLTKVEREAESVPDKEKDGGALSDGRSVGGSLTLNVEAIDIDLCLVCRCRQLHLACVLAVD